MIPFNKISNYLRRLDEAEPGNTRLNPAETWHGGFSAHMARLRRGAKSRRKAAARFKRSRRIH